MNQVPRWRLAAGIAVLAALVFVLADFAPYYFRNLELQNYVSDITHRGPSQTQSDDVLRTWVVEKAHQLRLPVSADDVHVSHLAEGLQIDVRYMVSVNLPGYSVNLHFYPGAGSR
ncbi:MAG TPA: hypothetical protein VE959_31290 [Bryobacteraceae bacterium]|nr:hypothetical protein [Bryobacteraceae bacterium]